MPAQKRESKRNYIGILNDRLEDQLPADPPAASGRPVKDYLLDLVATVLNRHRDGGLIEPSSPNDGLPARTARPKS
jgi:hypothetical protein